jgi:hypothetical protein
VIRGQAIDRSRTPVIILDADDIVLAEIAAGLDLDQLQQNLAGIFQPVGSFCQIADAPEWWVRSAENDLRAKHGFRAFT